MILGRNTQHNNMFVEQYGLGRSDHKGLINEAVP